MSKKQKYYVVWQGRQPGIYTSWEDCKKQIDNYPQPKYKSFKFKDPAEKSFAIGYTSYFKNPIEDKPSSLAPNQPKPILDSIAVDAACAGNPGIMEYRGVNTQSKEEIFRKGPFKQSTNNIGEFLALVHALALMKQNGDQRIIYSDSQTAISWVKQKKAKSRLTENKLNTDSFELVRRAEYWLRNNTYSNQILKWNTKIWGEIPADFGRK